MNASSSIGVVLGRFQPLHPGHIQLMEMALQENDRLVVCIGSAQIHTPLTIEQRRSLVQKQLVTLGYSESRFAIVPLVDPDPIDTWPELMKELCMLDDATQNRFYRGEQIEPEWRQRLIDLGFELREVERIPFLYQDVEGVYHRVSSATEINKINEGYSLENARINRSDISR